MTAASAGLPDRRGPRPTTTSAIPHRQLDQRPPAAVVDRLVERMFGRRAGVHEEPSRISVPGARALVVDQHTPAGPVQAFITGREFAHLHPAPDHSLHLTLPIDLAQRAVRAGWAEPHVAVATGLVPATVVMVYAPRDDAEAGVVTTLLEHSYRFATNSLPDERLAMRPDEMSKLIEEHITAEAAADLDGTTAVYTDDIEHDMVGSPAGPGYGIPAARAFYAALTRDIHTEQMPLTRGYYGDNFAVTEHQWTGTVPGTFLGLPGNGRRISFRLLHVWEFRDGRISRENVWLDSASIITQLTTSAAAV